MRAARTDAGVSAAINVLNLKLILSPPDMPEGTSLEAYINSFLSPAIRVWKIIRTTGGFHSRTMCDSRMYNYSLPTYCFVDPKPSTSMGERRARNATGYRNWWDQQAANGRPVEMEIDAPLVEGSSYAVTPKDAAAPVIGVKVEDNADPSNRAMSEDDIDPSASVEVGENSKPSTAVKMELDDRPLPVVKAEEADRRRASAKHKVEGGLLTRIRSEEDAESFGSVQKEEQQESLPRVKAEEDIKPSAITKEGQYDTKSHVKADEDRKPASSVKSEADVRPLTGAKMEGKPQVRSEVGEARAPCAAGEPEELGQAGTSADGLAGSAVSAFREDQRLRKAYRIPQDTLARLRSMINAYSGSHNFWNFTVGKEFGDRSCQRVMKQLTVSM